MVAEFLRAANFVLDSHGNVADAYDYLFYVYELLGIDAVASVQKLLDSPDIRLRYFAADKLAQMNDESAVDPLLLTLNDPNLDPWMRVTAAWDQGMLHATEALPDFERLATADSKAEVRQAALHGLAELGDCNSREVLTHALDDLSEGNRRLAAIILKRLSSGRLCTDN